MNCELCRSEMYAWRPNEPVEAFQEMFAHIESCPECSSIFAGLSRHDDQLRKTFAGVPESALLEQRILMGLRHDRAHTLSRRRKQWAWLLIPVMASLLLMFGFNLGTWFQDRQFESQVAELLKTPPELQMNSDNRGAILRWSDNIIPGLSTLPQRLSRIEFRGATAVRVAKHDAVLLKMKNEQRASLVVFQGTLLHSSELRTMRRESGSEAVWSDGGRTYALLFLGSSEEMQAYMNRMGITS